MEDYRQKIHVYGRIWMIAAFFLLMSIPIVISLMLGVWPSRNEFIQGFIATAVIYWTVTTIEVFTFAPMLGSGGTYLGFVTGNLTNLKVPAAMNAMNALDVKMGTEQGDVISTIAIASSSIITTIIIMLGALILLPITPLLEAELLQPAFNNIIPALFGALGVVYVSQNWKVAIPPIVVMLVIFLSIPEASGMVAIFVPLGCIIAVITARWLYLREKKRDQS